MTYSETLQKFGLPASPAHRDEVRRLLAEEIELARNWKSREEMLRTLCAELFSMGAVEDSLLIWDAKRSNMDAGFSVDVQFLCGAGLDVTKQFLAKSSAPSAAAALEYLVECEQTGDFDDWTPQKTLAESRRYYRIS